MPFDHYNFAATRIDPQLFSGGRLDEALTKKAFEMRRTIDKASEQHVLGVDPEKWAASLSAEYAVEVPVLSRDQMELVDEGEKPVDVSHEHFTRAIEDPSRPVYVAGHRVVLVIPFEGDAELFKLRPNRYRATWPNGFVEGRAVHVPFQWASDGDPPDLEAMARASADEIEAWLGWAREQGGAHNSGLERLAREEIEARRKRLLTTRTRLDNVGIPVRRRADAPTTYAAPAVMRRKAPARPKARASETGPPMEPILVGDLYQHIKSVVRSWGRAVERTPGPWTNAKEEALRDALLPMLNSHYEGGATGETFNASGKTDILIRVEDRTVFIAECKWWSGPKAVAEALDQLFSYATWRDTKLSLVFFVSAANPSKVVEKAREVLEGQAEFVRWQASEERELQCEFTWRGETSMRADLAVFFFHLPRG